MFKTVRNLLTVVFIAISSTPSFSWEVTEEKDDFSEQKKFTALHLEGGFVFFFNCTTDKKAEPELRIATTMDWTTDLREQMDLQFKGPDSPLITITSDLTANQSNKVLFVSNPNEAADVLGLMKAFADTKNHVSFRLSETGDSTKISGRGFGKIFKKLDSECGISSDLAL